LDGHNLCHSVVLFHNDGSASYPLAKKVHVTGLEMMAELFKALGRHGARGTGLFAGIVPCGTISQKWIFGVADFFGMGLKKEL